MTSFERGDLVLVPFQFTDKPIAKNRPALVISTARYHAARQEIIIAALTSRVREPLLFGDHLVRRWQDAGLPKPSVVTAILRTVKARMIVQRLGALEELDMHSFEMRLAEALSLPR